MKDILLKLKVFVSKVWTLYLGPVFKIFSQQALSNVLDIAWEFVQAAAVNPDLKSGDARRLWVAEQLKKHEWIVGNKIADYIINLAIELAVARLREAAAN